MKLSCCVCAASFEISLGRCQKWTIVSVYAPTANSSIEEINKFYSDVLTSINQSPGKDQTIILGDWNARVGKRESCDALQHVIGCGGIGHRND